MTSAPPRTQMRQQLDELDALLQRMLDLPINQVEPSGAMPEPPPAPRPVTYEPPRAPVAPQLQDGWKQPAMTLLADSGPVQPPAEPEAAGWDPGWSINLNPQNGSSVIASRRPAPQAYSAAIAQPPPAVFRSETVGYTLPETPPEPTPYMPPAPQAMPQMTIPEPAYRPRPMRSEPPPLLAYPFVWLNSFFDAVVGLVPLGSLFSTRIGKNVVGIVGIAMVLGGAAWAAAEYFGWPQ